jgi:hypothetical protein
MDYTGCGKSRFFLAALAVCLAVSASFLLQPLARQDKDALSAAFSAYASAGCLAAMDTGKSRENAASLRCLSLPAAYDVQGGPAFSGLLSPNKKHTIIYNTKNNTPLKLQI